MQKICGWIIFQASCTGNVNKLVKSSFSFIDIVNSNFSDKLVIQSIFLCMYIKLPYSDWIKNVCKIICKDITVSPKWEQCFMLYRLSLQSLVEIFFYHSVLSLHLGRQPSALSKNNFYFGEWWRETADLRTLLLAHHDLSTPESNVFSFLTASPPCSLTPEVFLLECLSVVSLLQLIRAQSWLRAHLFRWPPDSDTLCRSVLLQGLQLAGKAA